MHIILGGTGHVGSATTRALLARGEQVTVVTREADRAGDLERQGATVAVTDVHDPAALRAVLRRGRRAFLLNPPADPSTDTDREERATVRSILAALDGSGLEGVVAQSTYGAQPGEALGDLSVLHDLEQGLARQAIPAAILRAAYYFTNWDGMLGSARTNGVLPSMLPADLTIPMVSPEDLGRVAADLLADPALPGGLHAVEGPSRLSPADVAAIFAEALGRPVRVAVTPRDRWEETFRSFGVSEPAARSYARMTAITVDGGVALPDAPIRGTVTLRDHVASLVEGSPPT